MVVCPWWQQSLRDDHACTTRTSAEIVQKKCYISGSFAFHSVREGFPSLSSQLYGSWRGQKQPPEYPSAWTRQDSLTSLMRRFFDRLAGGEQ